MNVQIPLRIARLEAGTALDSESRTLTKFAGAQSSYLTAPHTAISHVPIALTDESSPKSPTSREPEHPTLDLQSVDRQFHGGKGWRGGFAVQRGGRRR